MRNVTLIGLVAGLVSAVVFVSASVGPLPMRAALYFLAPHPLYVAGLGWGWRAALAGGIAATLAVGGATGHALGAITYCGVEAAPAVLLTYLATLHRTVAAAPGGTPAVEWYPIGRLVIWTALISAVLSLVTVAVLGESREALIDALKKLAEDVIENRGTDGKPADKQAAGNLASILYALLPFASAVSWMASILANLWTAGRITAASGRMQRPWPDIPSMTYPPGTPLLLALALGAWMLPEPVGRIGAAFSGGMMFAYVLVGLAIVHFVTRGQPWRPFVLWALYLALIVLNTAASVLIALLGLAESFKQFRRDASSGPTET